MHARHPNPIPSAEIRRLASSPLTPKLRADLIANRQQPDSAPSEVSEAPRRLLDRSGASQVVIAALQTGRGQWVME